MRACPHLLLATIGLFFPGLTQGEPLPLTSRLAQSVNPRLRREALEELYVTRDRAAIDQLFQWTLQPPPIDDFRADEMLIALGKGKKDIYDRAWELLHGEQNKIERFVEQLGSPKFAEREAAHEALDAIGVPALAALEKASATSEDAEIRRRAEALAESINLRVSRDEQARRWVLGRIMACVDPDRACDDFARLLQSESPSLRQIAARNLGVIGNEKAMNLAFELLEEPDVFDHARRSLCDFFCENHQDVLPVERARLQELASALSHNDFRVD